MITHIINLRGNKLKLCIESTRTEGDESNCTHIKRKKISFVSIKLKGNILKLHKVASRQRKGNMPDR